MRTGSNCRLFDPVLITQGAQACCAEHQGDGARYFDSNPARSQHTKEMAAGKKQDISRYRLYTLHDAISARGDLLWRFAARTTIAEQLPVRTFRADLGRASAFIFAVVPFNEVAVDFRRR